MKCGTTNTQSSSCQGVEVDYVMKTLLRDFNADFGKFLDLICIYRGELDDLGRIHSERDNDLILSRNK